MEKKLCISLIFVACSCPFIKLYISRYAGTFYANFVKILEICKDFSKNLVNELGNIPRLESYHVFQTSKLLL